MIGQTIAHYRVTGKLGEGGMGVVYRALDTKLNREVALKVLPDSLADDADYMARFQREAQVLAALNHPHIAAIYGVEDRALVMELVEGETLADRIAQGPISVEEATPIARQIAEAIEAAHEKNIVHRDLKPANVKFTSEGTVKVLDFGIAKTPDAAPVDPVSSPTRKAMSGTLAGMIMGTAAYMAPEQARGLPVDRRADVWAYGAVLFEMLTGKPAFDGETMTDILAAVVRSEPDWNLVPPRMRKLVRRCLTKDKRQRLQAIGEARIALDEMPQDAEVPPVIVQPARTRLIPWLIAAAALVLAGVSFWGTLRPAAAPRTTTRWTATFPNIGKRSLFAFSPDGSRLAYIGEPTQIHLRALDQPFPQALPGTEGATQLFFSPDGQWIGFFTRSPGRIKKVALTGGVPITIADWRDTGPGSGVWTPDDHIIFSGGSGGGLTRIPAAGGTAEEFVQRDRDKDEAFYSDPQLLPGGKYILVTVIMGSLTGQHRQAAMIDLKTREKRILRDGAASPRYAASGHLLFQRDGSFFAAPFDLKSLQIRGSEVPVIEDVSSSPWLTPSLALSPRGTLVYLPADDRDQKGAPLVWVDRKGTETPAAPPGRYDSVRLSPDGMKAATVIQGQIWVYDLQRGTNSRITFDGTARSPLWSPDGKRIVYYSETGRQRGVYSTLADGSGKPEFIAAFESSGAFNWSPDGKALLMANWGERTDLWTVPVRQGQSPAGKPTLLLESPFNKFEPTVSPDGKWLAYRGLDSGRHQVYVQPYPSLAGKWQISTDGGSFPKWSHDGKELFYRAANGTLMAVDVRSQPQFEAGKPVPLFRITAGYEVAPDGRFLVIKIPPATEGAQPIHVEVITDWFEELKRRVPVQ